MFLKAVVYDFKCGLLKEYKKFILALFLFFIIGIDLSFRMFDSHLTIFDYFFYLFFGMEEYINSPGNQFRFPALWICLMILPSYITLYYPYKDLNGYGKIILLKMQNKKIWYLSKCVWIVFSTLLYFGLAFLVMICVSKFNKAIFTEGISFDVITRFVPMITAETGLNFNEKGYIIIDFIHFSLPVFVSVTANIMQLFLSLFLKPYISFVLTVSYAVASTYYLKAFMFFNYGMIGRSSVFLSNGVDFYLGLILSSIIILVSVLVGIIVFSKQDIINRE